MDCHTHFAFICNNWIEIARNEHTHTHTIFMNAKCTTKEEKKNAIFDFKLSLWERVENWGVKIWVD